MPTKAHMNGEIHYFFNNYTGSLPATSDPLALPSIPGYQGYYSRILIYSFATPPAGAVDLDILMSNDGTNYIIYENGTNINGSFVEIYMNATFIKVRINSKTGGDGITISLR